MNEANFPSERYIQFLKKARAFFNGFFFKRGTGITRGCGIRRRAAAAGSHQGLTSLTVVN
jgi:hypothetical protein